VSDEVLVDLLRSWEQWTGTAKDFHDSLGLSKSQLGGLMGKAKKLCREGNIALGDFKEVKLDGLLPQGAVPCSGIELCLEQGKIIRFPQVEQLIEFLKKSA
jgi:hypothetical protein